MTSRPPFRYRFDPTRRNLILRTLAGAGALTSPYLIAASSNCCNAGHASAAVHAGHLPSSSCSRLVDIGPLQAADSNGLRLPTGFRSRVIAIEGRKVGSSDYLWPKAPDGAATFSTRDGGWIYTVNSEATPGGVSAVRFDASGNIVDAYAICTSTRGNCAGGPTPWNTWLSCEEIGEDGFVWECDPWGREHAAKKPAMGAFNHEAVAVDPLNRVLYLTEDRRDGLFYRFIPSKTDWPKGCRRPALLEGKLQAFAADTNPRHQPSTGCWVDINDPDRSQSGVPTRTQGQAAGATRFNGGEGIWYHDGLIYFSTKGDNNIWLWDTTQNTLQSVYDGQGILTGVDNVTISCHGEVLVAEDGGDMQIVILLPNGRLKPLLQFEGHAGSEVTGPCFSPDGSRLYVSSQRGRSHLPFGRGASGGISYEILLP